jgi:hypothetical protein
MMKRFRIAVCALAFAGLALMPAAAGGHWMNSDGDWYFRGATTDSDDTLKRIDPVNFIFLGGLRDNSSYTRDRIEEHMDDDWSTRAVGGQGWRQDEDIRFFCKDDQRMVWVRYPSGATSDKTDWHGSTARFPGICGDQHHARFWDDLEHRRFVPSGHPDNRNQWAVGGIHHEKVRGAFGGHDIDRDWDYVRRELVRAMRRHCSESVWEYHPGADGPFGDEGYESSGFIARLSLHHVADGGCEGQ